MSRKVKTVTDYGCSYLGWFYPTFRVSNTRQVRLIQKCRQFKLQP